MPNKSKSKNKKSYEDCLDNATKRHEKGQLKLCPRGYCTAKHQFDVYPSAYANGYAVQVCEGTKPDYLDITESDSVYQQRIAELEQEDQEDQEGESQNDLQRWYKEEWVNVCEKGDGPGGYAICGSGKGIEDPENYPYCRAYHRLPGTPVVTAQELTQEEIDMMCKKKRSLPQGIKGKPTRITLPKKVRERQRKNLNMKGGGTKGAGGAGGTKGAEGASTTKELKIPEGVRDAAITGLELIDAGYKGGTQTGWDRGAQLAEDDTIDLGSLADMRTWFARHGPDARNGGTSYPGYCSWLEMGTPIHDSDVNKNSLKGAVSWLIWGGDQAYLWLKTPQIRSLLKDHYPNRKEASSENNLGC